MKERRDSKAPDLRPVSRRQFVALAGGSAAAIYLAGCSESEGEGSGTAKYGEGDVGILNYALTIEFVEAAFYASALKSEQLAGSGPDAKYQQKTFEQFEQQEKEHIAALTEAVERLDGDPAEEPETKFQMSDLAEILDTASTLENLTAAAYLGQVNEIENASALKTMLSIHTVEGRHAAAVNTLGGKPITPDGAFAEPASATSVLKSLEPFMVQ